MPVRKKATKAVTTTNLDKVLGEKNWLRSACKKPLLVVPKTKPECEEMFEMLENMMSPENISCDGERPRSQVQYLYNLYESAWKELEAIAGYKREPVI